MATIAELRLSIACGAGSAHSRPLLAFKIEEVDRCLAGRALDGGGLHEATAVAPKLVDEAAATLFLAGLATRFTGGAILSGALGIAYCRVMAMPDTRRDGPEKHRVVKTFSFLLMDRDPA